MVGLSIIANASAMTYYVSPLGLDTNAGTSTSTPWKTFDFAVASLQQGDTLILMDGNYTKHANGHLSIMGKNGSPSSPITIKAQNQRFSHLAGDGLTVTMRIDSSSYLVLDGLQVSSQDNASAASAPDPVIAKSSHHLTFKNMLLHHSNRYHNSHLMTLDGVTDSLVEDSELYYHHRHGILVYLSDRNTFRRVYCNSRGYGSIVDGFLNGHGTRGGDVCVSIYPGSHNLVENLISDGPQTMFDIQATSSSDGNRFLGVIGLGGWYGAVVKARGNSTDTQPTNTTIRDIVLMNTEDVGLYARGAKRTRCDHCTIIGSGSSGVIADVEIGSTGDGIASFYATNILSVNNRFYGIGVWNQTDWLVQYPNSSNNLVLQYMPSTSVNWVNEASLDPQLGPCTIYLPDDSPMKRAGMNGSDIGANVLYRYQDGILTTIPLWDPITGKFPCGNLVVGINDVAGSSCNDVHKRLNVNTNGCAFPSGYGNSPRG